MKKIIIPIIICILLSLICFASCGDELENGLKGTCISATSFQWNGDTASISVSKSTEVFSFNEKITVAEDAKYILASDIECKNEIVSKEVNLSTGDNTYYVCVTNGSAKKVYTFIIHRKSTCTVTFNTNGGEGIGSMRVEEGTPIKADQTSKPGYTFDGWSVNGETVSFPYKVNSDVTFDAIFTPIKYEIEYVLNGGVNNSENPSEYTIEDIIYLKEPTKADCGFVGWYTSADLSGESTRGISQGTTGKITFYASWKTSYKIEYELNGGVNNEENPLLREPNQEVVLLDPTRDGYEFLGWYSDSAFENEIKKISADATGAKKVYAKWTACENVLYYNANGGSGIMTSVTLYTDEEFRLDINLFKKTECTFVGWSTTPNGNVEYLNGSSFKMGPSDITLYAVWEDNEPVDTDITIFSGSVSNYTIVYPKDNEIIESQVKELVSYIKSTYNVQMQYKAVEKNMDVSQKEIIIGDARNKISFSTSQMSDVNDFVLDVSGDDFVIYAANDALYSYAIRIFKDVVLSEKIDNKLTIDADYTFSYKSSAYKDVTYVNYLKTNVGNYNKTLLCELFNGLSYTAEDGTTLVYRLYVPSNYDASKDYPVIVFLHGAGERGTDNMAQLGGMVPSMFNQQNTKIENAIVVAPQCPWNNQWVDTPWANGNYSIDNVPESNELKAVVELLNSIKNKYSTDENKYYAMGLSMGGFGTWDLIMRHTDMFAAAVPVCGGADVSQAENLKYMPIFTAHASNDGSVPYAGTEAMVEALRDAGSTAVIFKCHKDGSLSSGGHIIWDEIGGNPQMLEWLFSQSKEKKNILPEENETPFLPIN